MSKESYSYKQGFKKGIEIYTENKNNGYYSDEDNERVMKSCKRYADSGYKNGTALKETQIQYYFGMYDGIRYGYKQNGIRLPNERFSKFEENERNFYYGK